MVDNLTIDDCMQIRPSNVSAAKLTQFPQKYFWPRFNDFEGAKQLIDAVMLRDAAAIHKLASVFPEYDFQLGEWWVTLREEHKAAQRVTRKTLKRRNLSDNRNLRLELETDLGSGARTLVASFYRGQSRLSRKVLHQEKPHAR